jgi:hypothetical protein
MVVLHILIEGAHENIGTFMTTFQPYSKDDIHGAWVFKLCKMIS